ncbi:MAG: NADP oxidoreductase [Alphaproteobacteria bacterium]|nr:NADP oxidoreductase [Alphaproteobacteria bacterium]
MKFGVLGTGMVGLAIAGKLAALGHDVRVGARQAGHARAVRWVAQTGARGSQGTFADAAGFGELLFNCTFGAASVAALEMAGESALRGKILIDLANPLEYGANGRPFRLTVCNDDSLGEQIQRRFPDTRVVKALNTVSYRAMTNGGHIPGQHDMFISGNDTAAKAEVTRILREWFNWRRVIDLGDITTARGTEMYMMLWLKLHPVVGTFDFNIGVTATAGHRLPVLD